MSLSVSLVVYNHTFEELLPTLESVLSSSVVSSFYIIDNSSIDKKLLEHLNQLNDTRVVYQKTEKNIGFGAAHNLAIRQSMAQNYSFHLIVNPDIYFSATSLSLLYDYISEHSEVGLITPKIFYPDGTLQYHCKLLPTPYDWLLRGFPFCSRLTARNNQLFELHAFDYNTIANIPYLNGCCMLFRNETLKKVGLFDTNYFMYSEDCDITRRIHEIAETLFYPKSHIVHHFNRESHRNKGLFWIQIKSTIHYFNKWGWFFDKGRTLTNKNVLNRLKISK